MQIGSYLIGSIISIKNRHIAIHQYQLIVTFLTVVFSDVLLNFVYGFLSIECFLAYHIYVLNVESTIENDLNGLDVEDLVIDNENLFAGIL